MKKLDSKVLLRNGCLVLVMILLAGSAAAMTIPSLEGTDADGDLSLQANGSLTIDGEVLRFLDYFLSARGEVSDRLLHQRVREVAHAKLPRSAASELTNLFAHYVRYSDLAARRLEKHDPAQIQRSFEILAEVRTGIFGADLAGDLFGDQFEIERSALLLQKARLDASDEEQRLAARRLYEASLSAQERQARAAARKPLEISRRVAEMRRAGATDEEVWGVRAKAFGAPAADRLAALDRRRVASAGR